MTKSNICMFIVLTYNILYINNIIFLPKNNRHETLITQAPHLFEIYNIIIRG